MSTSFLFTRGSDEPNAAAAAAADDDDDAEVNRFTSTGADEALSTVCR